MSTTTNLGLQLTPASEYDTTSFQTWQQSINGESDSNMTKIDSAVGGKQSKITASGILKGDGDGGVSAATAGTDFPALSHTHAASDITAGYFAGSVKANTSGQSSLGISQMRNIYAQTTDLVAGTTALANGSICLIYE